MPPGFEPGFLAYETNAFFAHDAARGGRARVVRDAHLQDVAPACLAGAPSDAYAMGLHTTLADCACVDPLVAARAVVVAERGRRP